MKYNNNAADICFLCHSPRGECGLKFPGAGEQELNNCRHSPRGECGLKFPGAGEQELNNWSLPARGVWVEIAEHPPLEYQPKEVTPREGSVG